MENQVELRVVPDKEAAFSRPPDGAEPPAPLAAANQAVPLLWLSLFDYKDTDVRPMGAFETFASVTPVAAARSRAEVMLEVLPPDQAALLESARILSRELEKLEEEGHLVIFPAEVFENLPRDHAQAYIQQLVNLCDLWENLRGGLPWLDAYQILCRISPDLAGVLHHQDPRMVRYYLIGSLADRQESLDDYLIKEGQGKTDVIPEGLVVGEQGIVLGRFDGTWKLMSSGCREDLASVWGESKTAYMVGRSGTVLRMTEGRCTRMQVPTTQHLSAVWGLSLKSVCAAGTNGTVLVFNGQDWQPWPTGSQVNLHAIIGTSPDNICLAGQGNAVFRYDGYAWNALPLPEDGTVNQFCLSNEMILAAGGSPRGGQVYRLERVGFVKDDSFPHVDWLAGIWNGWGPEIGVAPGSGPVLVSRGMTWEREPVQVERTVAVAGGSRVMALGRTGKYDLILIRDEGRWRIDAAMKGLELRAIWAAGKPKPPRLPMTPPVGDARPPPGDEGPPEAATP